MNGLNLNNNSVFKQQAFINGAWVSMVDGRTEDILDPDSGQVVWTTPFLGADETVVAIEAASAALPAWRKMTAQSRGDILLHWHALIMYHRDVLAELMTAETGKPLNQSYGEVTYGVSFVET